MTEFHPKVHDAATYICLHYPFPGDLSKARLTKLVYLADWRMALQAGRQITPISWVYNHYGPYVKDIERLAWLSDDFEVHTETNAFGSRKERVEAMPWASWSSLATDEIAALDHVIAQTRHLTFADFLNLVYSTYPVEVSARYDTLDLPALARSYQQAAKADGA